MPSGPFNSPPEGAISGRETRPWTPPGRRSTVRALRRGGVAPAGATVEPRAANDAAQVAVKPVRFAAIYGAPVALHGRVLRLMVSKGRGGVVLLFPIPMGKLPAGSSKTQVGLGGSGIARNHKPGKRERARLVDVRLSLERVQGGFLAPSGGLLCTVYARCITRRCAFSSPVFCAFRCVVGGEACSRTSGARSGTRRRRAAPP